MAFLGQVSLLGGGGSGGYLGEVSLVGGIPLPGGTPGSVVFVGATGDLDQDNANFFWDNANNRLGIGTSAPTSGFSISEVFGAAPQAEIHDPTGGGLGIASLSINDGTTGHGYTGVNLSWLGSSNAGSLIAMEAASELFLGTAGVANLYISAAGHLRPFADNLQDLGSAAERYRTAYLGTSLVSPSVGPSAAQQHVLPAVASSAVAVLTAPSQTFTGNIAQQGGTFIATPTTAGTLTSLAGPLTLTGSTTALLGAGTGGVTINGRTGVNYLTLGTVLNEIQVQSGKILRGLGTSLFMASPIGNSALVLSDTSAALSFGGNILSINGTLSTFSLPVRMSGLLDFTGASGNINLPNNGTNRFQIESVAVSSAVTSANLGTLTAGATSNAAALHVHLLSGQTTGDLVQASSATAFARLADVAVGSVLTSGGVGVAPAYSDSPTLGGYLGLTKIADPGAGAASVVRLFSVDVDAGQTTFGLNMTEDAVVDIGVASTHSFKFFLNGQGYKIPLIII